MNMFMKKRTIQSLPISMQSLFNIQFHLPFLALILLCSHSHTIFSAAKVTSVSAGGSHTLLLKQNGSNPGSLWTVGLNANGQLGDGTNVDKNLPLEIVSSGITAISAGENHSLYLKSDGSLWAMGLNSSGQLGDGTTTDKNVSLEIVSSGVTAISAGGSHSLYLKSDGSLWAMGLNASGQLGDGTTVQRNTAVPVTVGGIAVSGVTAISAGGNHSLYIESDGSLWAMGLNSSGQLGDGNTANLSTPYKVEANGVTAIAAGAMHSLYIKNGKLWAMGENGDGQLGDSTVWDRSRPILVPGIEGTITDIVAGSNQSFYVRQNGIWAMGDNVDGQLGIGDGVDKNVSVQIPNSTNAIVSSGSAHSMLLKTDGSLSSAGKNTNGQLGIGSTTNNNDFEDFPVKAYFLKIDPTPSNGVGSITGSETNFAYGASASVTASPSNGYVFNSWTGDLSSTSSSYSFTVTQDFTFTPTFSQDNADDDNDSLSNYLESLSSFTDPSKPDSDGDGFTDFEEYSTAGLNSDVNDSAIRNLFLTKEQSAEAAGKLAGIALVESSPSSYSLFTQAQIDSEQQSGKTAGIALVTSNPSGYSLFTQAQKDSAQQSGETAGIALVMSNPSSYSLYTQSDLNSSSSQGYSLGFSDGNASGIAYVQANPAKYNFLTDAERNASYDLGYAAGLAEAEASALGEAQAKLAMENLSSLTYLEQIRDQSFPHTDGWYFQPNLGWLWTNRSTFPFIYRQATGQQSEGWLYFSELKEQQLKPLYDYNSNGWISISGN